MKIEKKKISELNPAKYNPRKDLKPSDPEYQRIKKSIDEFGCIEPLVWNKRSGNLVSGHQRLKILKESGVKAVEVSVVDLDDVKEKTLNLALNNNPGKWDDEKLELVLHELELADIDMELTGFEAFDLEEFLGDKKKEGETDPDEVPEEVPTVCKTGDLWQLGEHRLLCGDATKAEDVEKLMAGEKADMVFTDPPYSVGIGDKNRSLQSMNKAGRITSDLKGDNKTVKETAEMLWKPSFELLGKYLNNDGSYYLTAPQGGDQMMMMMMSSSIPCRHELIWIKNQPAFSMGRLDYDYQHEPILYGWKGKHKFYGSGEFTKSIWSIDRVRKCDLHPTMKPIALIINAIQNSSRKADIVIDLFGGSGSTLIACEQTERKCHMMEIDPHYCDVVITRWENFTGAKASLLNPQNGKKKHRTTKSA